HTSLFRSAAPGQVRFDERDGARITLHERDVCGTPAERLDPDRARAGVAVEDACALDARRQDVEQRLAQLVGGRTQALPCRGLQPSALEAPRDHSHVYPTSMSPNCC